MLYLFFLNNYFDVYVHRGMDIPDIEREVQFMVASSLSVHVQRLGRTGRSGKPSLSILLAEPSVFQTVKKKPKKNKDDVVKVEDLDDDMLDSEGEGCLDNIEIKYKKNLEHGMREWTQTLTCRRETSNKYFNNPVRLKGHVHFYSHAVTV
jgi:superfamily II DNA/RNA helicase